LARFFQRRNENGNLPGVTHVDHRIAAGNRIAVKGEALRHDVNAAEYARKIIDDALAKPVPDQAGIDVLTKWERDNATDDPDEIARRQKEFEELKRGDESQSAGNGGAALPEDISMKP
jgi:hypothetical protein